MPQKIKVLLASRAIESPPREGGFVLLSDLAKTFAADTRIGPYVFSSTEKAISHIGTEKVFSRPGWNARLRAEFMRGLFSRSHKFDIVHTAHIPTPQNSFLIKAAIRKARRRGTLFVQTVTGLPEGGGAPKKLDRLLWGDYIVCQSPLVYEKVKRLGRDASLITPWPPASRIKYDAGRRRATRAKLFPGAQKIVLFPGEFDRLGVDDSFAECLRVFFEKSSDSIVVFACRFDTKKTGERLREKFPGRVVSLGETSDIVPLMEAADLTIYPVRKMASKFQPPLVLMESIQLGTPVLASPLVGLDAPGWLESQDLSRGWAEFGERMARAVSKPPKQRSASDNSAFEKMADAYRDIYVSLRQ